MLCAAPALADEPAPGRLFGAAPDTAAAGSAPAGATFSRSFQSGGLLLASALLILHRRLSHLPARLVAILRQERAQDDARSLWALQEATAMRVAACTAALRAHEEQVAASFQAQIADAETHAWVAGASLVGRRRGALRRRRAGARAARRARSPRRAALQISAGAL